MEEKIRMKEEEQTELRARKERRIHELNLRWAEIKRHQEFGCSISLTPEEERAH